MGDLYAEQRDLITCKKNNIPILSLEFQYGSGVPVGVHPANEVEVAHVEGAVGADGQRHGGKQHHVPGCAAAARAAGNAPVEAVPHDGADDRRLLGQEYVFSISFVKDSWGETSAINTLNSLKEKSVYCLRGWNPI